MMLGNKAVTSLTIPLLHTQNNGTMEMCMLSHNKFDNSTLWHLETINRKQDLTEKPNRQRKCKGRNAQILTKIF